MIEGNGRGIVPLMDASVIGKFLPKPSDEIKIQIIKTDAAEPKNYAEFQAVIIRSSGTTGLRTPIPERKDFMPALSLTLMSILQEIEKNGP